MGKRRFEPNEKDFSILKKTSLNLRKMRFKLSVLNEVKYDIIAILYLKLKIKSNTLYELIATIFIITCSLIVLIHLGSWT